MNTDIWSLRPWKYSGSSTSWMMTTFPSAGAVILRPSPAGLRLGSLKKQMKNTANPIGMQKSIQYRTFGAPKYHDVPPRSTAKTSAISIVTAPSLCIFMTLSVLKSKQCDVQDSHRKCQQRSVEPVQQSSVPGHYASGVLDSKVTL